MIASGTTFDSTKESLHDILNGINSGKTQLPDFQRGWIWDDDHIRSLLASISLTYPIGAIMLLETGNPDVRLRPRPIEGVELPNNIEPERLILDGQQRMTSLYQALYVETPVNTRDARRKQINRHYYIDIKAALSENGDREDAIVSLPEDRKIRNFRNELLHDYSTQENEFEHGLFPIYRIYNYHDWAMGFQEYWNFDKEKIQLFHGFVKSIIQRFEQYQVPVIALKKATPKIAVCQVFEKVNTGGVALNVFELLTASFAADNFNLRDDWADREKELHKIPVLKGIDSSLFLQSVTLLCTWKGKTSAADGWVTCKRKDVLSLSLENYLANADAILRGLKSAAKLLHAQRLFSSRDVPYTSQFVPLAAILAALDGRANDTVYRKILRWYWCGVFGELYGGAIETRFAKDLPEVLAYVDGGSEPTTIGDANFAQSRLRGLRSRNSAAYKGLYISLMRDGCLDFITGHPIDVATYFDESIDIHHVFPRNWCKKKDNKELGLDQLGGRKRIIDSLINKTPLSAKTNRAIGGHPPSQYLSRVHRQAGIEANRMDEILQSHLIDPDALRSDDFVTFFQQREHALLERIEKTMGKPIMRDVIIDEVDEQDDDDADDYPDPVLSIAEKDDVLT